MKQSLKQLSTTGFVSLAYPRELRDAVESTVEAWKDFCALPVDVKTGLPYSNNADGVGYELKDGVGHKTDRKENFDVALGGKDWFEQHIGSIKSPVAVDFVEQAAALVQLMKPLVDQFARECGEQYHIPGFAEEVSESGNAFFVRFIHYFGDRTVGEETATAHTDQSGFTLHLYESDPGLQCLPVGGEWIDMPVSTGETVIIPSMQLQLRSEGKLKALCHRVIATENTAITGRYSAVCFVQLAKTPKYDKNKHGRLQEKTPGFNYELSPEEFARLFKPA